MRNLLYIIALSLALVSCGSQKATQKVVANPKPAATKPAPVKPSNPKPMFSGDGQNDYYKVNIADASKKDNTISYGSIVTAKPANYHVVKTYFPALAQNFRQKYLIMHYTALNTDKSVMVLTQQSVSAHYLLNDLDDKEIYQLVDENKRAYHAGISYWRKDDQLNDNSIGIEIVNTGFTTDASGNRQFYPYPEWQYKKIAALVKDIVDRYQIPPTNILGHSDVAPTRKQDPGPLFPWKRLYTEYGLGMWYDDAVKMSFQNTVVPENFAAQMATSAFIFNVQKALQQFGYYVEPSGTLDDATKKIIQAFQFHFRPELSNGVMDVETWAILQALIQKYPSK